MRITSKAIRALSFLVLVLGAHAVDAQDITGQWQGTMTTDTSAFIATLP